MRIVAAAEIPQPVVESGFLNTPGPSILEVPEILNVPNTHGRSLIPFLNGWGSHLVPFAVNDSLLAGDQPPLVQVFPGDRMYQDASCDEQMSDCQPLEFVDEVQLGTVEDKAEIIGLHSMSQLQNRHRIDEIDEQVVVTKIG